MNNYQDDKKGSNMYGNTAHNIYAQNNVGIESPEKLIAMLYEGILRFNAPAKKAIRDGDIEKRVYWTNRSISSEPKKTIAHAMGAWSVNLFKEVGGYPLIQSGQDQAIEQIFKKTKFRKIEKTPIDKIYYIYRFPGTGSYHLSSCGYGRGFEETEKYVNKKEIKGRHIIKPNWSQNFIQMIEKIIKERE